MMRSNRIDALRNPMGHTFIPGVGYVSRGEPKVAPVTSGAVAPVQPKASAAKASLHDLVAPGGAVVTLRWRSGAWWHPVSIMRGNRMAWTPEYLARAGWVYKGPAS